MKNNNEQNDVPEKVEQLNGVFKEYCAQIKKALIEQALIEVKRTCIHGSL